MDKVQGKRVSQQSVLEVGDYIPDGAKFCAAMMNKFGFLRKKGSFQDFKKYLTDSGFCPSHEEATTAPWAEKTHRPKHGVARPFFGRLRAKFEELRRPQWETALRNLGKFECSQMVNRLQQEAVAISRDVYRKHIRLDLACVDRMVRKVGAEIMGCCGQACGWDGELCTMWPFFFPAQKVDWQLECCAEMNVLKGSSRERMCNSVLPPSLRRRQVDFDRDDIGQVIMIGQDPLSFLETNSEEYSTNTCPTNLLSTSNNVSMSSWSASRDFDTLLRQKGGCILSKPEHLTTPEECQRKDAELAHYFKYDLSNEKNPITCFAVGVTSNHCKAEELWWAEVKDKLSPLEFMALDGVDGDFNNLWYVKPVRNALQKDEILAFSKNQAKETDCSPFNNSKAVTKDVLFVTVPNFFKKAKLFEKSCACLNPGEYPSLECNDQVFSLSQFRWWKVEAAKPGCACLTREQMAEKAAGTKMPVKVSALEFCSALAEEAYKRNEFSMDDFMEGQLKSNSSAELCQHALVGRITEKEGRDAPWAKKASDLSSQSGSDFGRMKVAEESAEDSSSETDGNAEETKDMWKKSLSRVCHDECELLVEMINKNAEKITEDLIYRSTPFIQSCSDHVVKKVEAEIMGCCGRACGWNGEVCALWPFFPVQQKIDWRLQCCSEFNILEGSTREVMCNAALPPRLAEESSKHDLKEGDANVWEVLFGQNTSLYWTPQGADSEVGRQQQQAIAGKEVSADFLRAHQNIGKKYLKEGWFRQGTITEILDEETEESSSFIENPGEDGKCNFGNFSKMCGPTFHSSFMESCRRSWDVAVDFPKFLLKCGCPPKGPQPVETLEHCINLTEDANAWPYFQQSPEKKNSIQCYSVNLATCTRGEKCRKIIHKELSPMQKFLDPKKEAKNLIKLWYVKSNREQERK